MDVLSLLDAATAAGLTVTVDKDRLQVTGPRSAEPIVRQLYDYKPAVMAVLAAKEAGPVLIANDPGQSLSPPAGSGEPLSAARSIAGQLRSVRVQWNETERARWQQVADKVTRRLRLRVRGEASPERWHQMCDDAHRFIEQGWWHRALVLGWDRLELFGADRVAPWARYNRMGLVLLIRGGQVIGMDNRTAKIETLSGGHQTYARAPLDRGEVVLIDELACQGEVRECLRMEAEDRQRNGHGDRLKERVAMKEVKMNNTSIYTKVIEKLQPTDKEYEQGARYRVDGYSFETLEEAEHYINWRPSAEAKQWRAIRKEEGLRIDPETAEVTYWHASVLDPYGIYPDMPEVLSGCVGREYFARNPGSDIWVSFDDLPRATDEALCRRAARLR
jgi:hypothetical protein